MERPGLDESLKGPRVWAAPGRVWLGARQARGDLPPLPSARGFQRRAAPTWAECPVGTFQGRGPG